MKHLIILTISMFIFTGMKKMSDIELETTDGAKISLENYKEKTILVVNIATRCGYTGQLDDLEKIYKKYKTKGFIVLGLPSNDFGGQTPEENKDVAKFCRLKYGTSFPILKKTSVTGATKHPIIKDLLEKTDKKEISWNFEKFLIKKDGSVQRFPSSTNPSSQTFTKAIESAL